MRDKTLSLLLREYPTHRVYPSVLKDNHTSATEKILQNNALPVLSIYTSTAGTYAYSKSDKQRRGK